ncbi:hypothetical protein V8C44DRAFT_113885 [Trichoderma aethiopicum]
MYVHPSLVWASLGVQFQRCRVVASPQTMLHTVRALLSNAPVTTETTHHQPHSPPEFSRCRHHDVFALRPSHRYDTADSSFAATSSRLSSGAASSGRLNAEPCLRDRRAEVGRQGRLWTGYNRPRYTTQAHKAPAQGFFGTSTYYSYARASNFGATGSGRMGYDGSSVSLGQLELCDGTGRVPAFQQREC